MCSVIAARRASMLPYSTWMNPGVYGPKWSRALSSSENETMVVVRPWKLPSATMIDGLVRGDPLDRVAPLARDLDRGLDGLGAGVHRQDHVLAGQGGELGAEGAELVVVERPADQGDPVELLVGRGEDLGVAVAEVQRRVAGQAVEVAVPGDVGDPGARGSWRSPPAAGGSCAPSAPRPTRSARPRCAPRRPLRAGRAGVPSAGAVCPKGSSGAHRDPDQADGADLHVGLRQRDRHRAHGRGPGRPFGADARPSRRRARPAGRRTPPGAPRPCPRRRRPCPRRPMPASRRRSSRSCARRTARRACPSHRS